MAIIALIVTPLVMSIIRKARISADKRSIDAYGRSIELAIAGYLLDTGKFPTDISQLTIEYSGDEVVCETTQINPDSSVYLAGCKVKGRAVTNYTYGIDKSPSYKAYNIGDEVTYNNVDYYVIKDSSASDSTVTLLKAEPLTVAEVNQYGGVGTENNHVNKYTYNSVGTAYDHNGYGGVAYYTSETCRGDVNYSENTGCTTDYAQSEVKYVVDGWSVANVPSGLKDARLISFEDLKDNLGCEFIDNGSVQYWSVTENTPSWVRINGSINGEYSYWTMSAFGDSNNSVITAPYIRTESVNGGFTDGSSYRVVRPVIILDKSVLSS